MSKTDKAPLKDFGGKECSDEFYHAFCDSGSIAISCEACGRVHYYYLDDPGCYDPGEFDELEAKHKADPERYCPRDTDSIDWAVILGTQVVFDCPCGYAAMIERLIWVHRHDISDYLVAKANARLKDAQYDAERMDALRQPEPETNQKGENHDQR